MAISASSQPAEVGDTDSHKTQTLAWDDGTTLELVWIPGGSFHMGSRKGDSDERPVREIEIPGGFWMSRTEVTQEQFQQAAGYNPSHFQDPNRPVETVNLLEDVKAFLGGVFRSGVAPQGLLPRLPTEAEWEYASRAGSDGAFCFGDDPERLADHGWYAANSGGRTQPVGQKQPNAFGLYDMHGNVWEWCSDWYMETYYEINEQHVGPIGPSAGGSKVLRGGSWNNAASYCRSANRFRFRPWSTDDSIGIRLVLSER